MSSESELSYLILYSHHVFYDVSLTSDLHETNDPNSLTPARQSSHQSFLGSDYMAHVSQAHGKTTAYFGLQICAFAFYCCQGAVFLLFKTIFMPITLLDYFTDL